MVTGEARRAALLRTHELVVTGNHLGHFLTRERSRAERYTLALLSTGIAAAATIAFLPQLERAVFVLFWPAVLFSAIVAGTVPAILSSLLAILVVELLVLAPPGHVGHLDPSDVSPLLAFLVTSFVMSSIANALRVARMRATDATHALHQVALELDEQATELEQRLKESQSLQEALEQTSTALALRTQEAEAASAFSVGILASISDPFVVHDAAWRFAYINASAAQLFASTGRAVRGSLIGQRVWDAYPDLVGSDIEREMRRAATARIPVTFEAYYAETGTWSVMSCYPLSDGGLATQWKDVTARRRAEENASYLARASDVLASSLDYETTLRELAHIVVPELAAWCTIHVVGPDGDVRQVALAHRDPEQVKWAEALNERYPPDQHAAQGVPNVLRTGVPELYPAITEEMLLAGTQDDEHRRIIQALGLRSAMIVPLAARGRILGALSLLSVGGGRRYGDADLELAMELGRRAALAVDNALLHRAELRARIAADDANAAKMQFLTVMSHELRTPLNAIGGYAELMRLGIRGPISDVQAQDLDRIMSSQRHLLGLINDILNFAKIEAGHVELHLSNVPVRQLLADVEMVVAPQLLMGTLSFATPTCPADLLARGDPEKIRQIVLNLLSNAIKFTPSGGVVTLRADGFGDSVRIEVLDTGVGIAPDRLAAVFDPFVQLDRSLTSSHEGTGLGLAISRDLARAMHGDITARSEPGRGSAFTLTMPRARAPV